MDPNRDDRPRVGRADWRGRLAQIVALDLRSLALFRMALAGAFLYDVADRARDLVAHYSDAGLLPAETLARFSGSGGALLVSPHYHLSASVPGEAALFALAGLAGLALALGWHTRLATALCWFLLVGVQLRNPALSAMGGDKLLRLLLFWGLFLPLGARASLDARRRRASPGSNRHLSIAGAALLVQVALVYLATGLHKSGPTWKDGSAVYYALNLDYYVTPLGAWLRRHESVLPVLSHATRWFEILGWLPAFSPFWNGPLRLASVAAFAVFHLSLALCLSIGPFPAICLAGWMAFVPGWFWDEWLPRLRGARAARPGPAAAGGLARPVSALVALLLAYVCASVLSTVGVLPRGLLPGVVQGAGRLAGLDQKWTMFSPDPRPIEAWLVPVGMQRGRPALNPLSGRPLAWDTAQPLKDQYPGFRWRMYLLPLAARDEHNLAQPILWEQLAAYLCRRWNGSAPEGERIDAIALYGLAEETPAPNGVGPNGAARPAPTRSVLYRRPCEP